MKRLIFAFLAVAALLGTPGHTRTQPAAFSIPFREVNHRMLIDVNVDDHPATLLFDTGAAASVVLRKTHNDCKLFMHRGQFFCVGETSVAFQQPEEGVHFDGFLGADITSRFSTVAIDYTNHVLVFSEKP